MERQWNDLGPMLDQCACTVSVMVKHLGQRSMLTKTNGQRPVCTWQVIIGRETNQASIVNSVFEGFVAESGEQWEGWGSACLAILQCLTDVLAPITMIPSRWTEPHLSFILATIDLSNISWQILVNPLRHVWLAIDGGFMAIELVLFNLCKGAVGTCWLFPLEDPATPQEQWSVTNPHITASHHRANEAAAGGPLTLFLWT